MSKPQLRISDSRLLIECLSEPYVIFTGFGYQPAIDVRDVQSGEVGYLVISAVSLGSFLHEIAVGRGGSLCGATFSVRKESKEKMAKYLVESTGLE